MKKPRRRGGGHGNWEADLSTFLLNYFLKSSFKN